MKSPRLPAISWMTEDGSCIWTLFSVFQDFEKSLFFTSFDFYFLVTFVLLSAWYVWRCLVEFINILIIDLYFWFAVATGVPRGLTLDSHKVSVTPHSFYSCAPIYSCKLNPLVAIWVGWAQSTLLSSGHRILHHRFVSTWHYTALHLQGTLPGQRKCQLTAWPPARLTPS